MPKKKINFRLRTLTIMAFIAIFSCALGTRCVAPGAVKAKVGVKEHKVDNDVSANKIDNVDNSVEQNSYGGAGWVLLTTTVFLIGIGTFFAWSIKRVSNYKGMLFLVTTAVYESQPHVRQAIKKGVKQRSRSCKNGHKYRKHLSKECIKNNVFAKNH